MIETQVFSLTTKDMQVFIGDQARVLFDTEKVPSNSIGVFFSNMDEWVYWFSDSWYFDSGSAETEIDALRKAKDNLR